MRHQQVERSLHGRRSDEDGEVERFQAVGNAVEGAQILNLADLDRGKQDRLAARLMDERCKAGCLLARTRDQYALPGKRADAHLDSAARIWSAPSLRSRSATRRPRVSGSADSPSASARAIRPPSGEATSARSLRLAPFSSANAPSGIVQSPPSARLTARSALTQALVAASASGATSACTSARVCRHSMPRAPCPGAGMLSSTGST